MALPTVSPPGGATWHVVLTLLGPSVMLLGGAAAAALSGWRRSALWIAGLALLAALGLCAAALRGEGAMGAFAAPVLQGHLRVGWIPTGAGAALLAAAAWRWRPRGRDPILWHHSPWSWCARCALAAALPVLLLPGLWLAAEVDHEGTEILGGERLRRVRVTLAVLGSLPAMLGLPAWLGAGALVATYLLAAISCRGWWPTLAAIAGLAVVADLVLQAVVA